MKIIVALKEELLKKDADFFVSLNGEEFKPHFSGLARKLGMSVSTVHDRWKRLKLQYAVKVLLCFEPLETCGACKEKRITVSYEGRELCRKCYHQQLPDIAKLYPW